jgi:hypothetical protein
LRNPYAVEAAILKMAIFEKYPIFEPYVFASLKIDFFLKIGYFSSIVYFLKTAYCWNLYLSQELEKSQNKYAYPQGLTMTACASSFLAAGVAQQQNTARVLCTQFSSSAHVDMGFSWLEYFSS